MQDTINWLLENDDPDVRFLTLKNIVQADAKLLKMAKKEALEKGRIPFILNKMHADGYWIKPGGGYGPKYKAGVWSLILLAQLGAKIEDDPRIAKAVNYYLDNACTQYGQIAYNGSPGGTIDCLQGNMCAALIELGCEDPRLFKAFEWMARTVTGEGIAQITDKKNPERYYSYKCGPLFACGANGKKPCAWGATKVLWAFSKLDKQKRTPLMDEAVFAGVEFLLNGNPAKAEYPTDHGQAPNRSWAKFGFPIFYVTDILQIAEVLTDLGFGNDARLADALRLIESKRQANGKWLMEYDYTGKTWRSYGKKGEPSKWVTYRCVNLFNKLAS